MNEIVEVKIGRRKTTIGPLGYCYEISQGKFDAAEIYFEPPDELTWSGVGGAISFSLKEFERHIEWAKKCKEHSEKKGVGAVVASSI